MVSTECLHPVGKPLIARFRPLSGCPLLSTPDIVAAAVKTAGVSLPLQWRWGPPP